MKIIQNNAKNNIKDVLVHDCILNSFRKSLFLQQGYYICMTLTTEYPADHGHIPTFSPGFGNKVCSTFTHDMNNIKWTVSLVGHHNGTIGSFSLYLNTQAYYLLLKTHAGI